MSAPDVSVVIVSYNALDWLRASVEAITTHVSDARVEVLVVDNASQPPVREYLAGAPGGVKPVLLEENIGFGRACNLGARRSEGRYVMLLNPDAVIHPGAVDALLAFAEADPRRGLVGGRSRRPDGGLDPGSCWGAPSLWSWFCSAVGLTAAFRGSRLFDPEALGDWQRDTPREVDIVSGCLLLASREVWDRLGGFDEDYFMYGEDADLSARARAAGYRPSITPAATVTHALSATTGTRLAKQRLLLTGKATLARKQWTPARARLGIALLRLNVGIRAGAELARRTESDTWRTLWHERAGWSKGWPPHKVGEPTTTGS